jgi:hypothetical protein
VIRAAMKRATFAALSWQRRQFSYVDGRRQEMNVPLSNCNEG